MDKRRRLLLATINRKEYIFQEGKGLMKGMQQNEGNCNVSASYIDVYGFQQGHTTIPIG